VAEKAEQLNRHVPQLPAKPGSQGRWLFNGLTVLSLILCPLSAFLALALDNFWVAGTVATINGKDQIVNDPRFLTEAKHWAVAAVVFAILPLFRLFRGFWRAI
jgi:hypothetical protein